MICTLKKNLHKKDLYGRGPTQRRTRKEKDSNETRLITAWKVKGGMVPYIWIKNLFKFGKIRSVVRVQHRLGGMWDGT